VRNRAIRTVLAAVVALAVPLTVAACGSKDKKSGNAGSGKPAISIGSKSFTEEAILGQLYGQALRAKGYKVTLKPNIGQTEIADKALTSGKIDMYPEYTGTTLSVVAGQKTKPKSAADAYAAAKKFYEGRGQTLTAATPFFDSDGLAVKKSVADSKSIKSLPDLKKLSGNDAKLGGAPEFATRDEGLLGLKKVYGLNNLKLTPLTIGLQYKALDQGKVGIAEVFTTDGALASGKYTVLDDPKKVFGFQNVAMVLPVKLEKSLGSGFTDAVNAVSAKLTNQAMQQMNAAVDIDKNKPADVAQKFLKANGLV
jgi:osmoprotectant transport system substrate-binding protein